MASTRANHKAADTLKNHRSNDLQGSLLYAFAGTTKDKASSIQVGGNLMDRFNVTTWADRHGKVDEDEFDHMLRANGFRISYNHGSAVPVLRGFAWPKHVQNKEAS